MSNYLTKQDLMQHEKEAAERLVESQKREQELRHKQGENYQKVIVKIDDKVDGINNKVDNNSKELALLKLGKNIMSENVKEIKQDMKYVKKDIREFISIVKDKYVTKEEYQENKKEIKEIKTDSKKVLISVISGLLGLIYLFIDKYF